MEIDQILCDRVGNEFAAVTVDRAANEGKVSTKMNTYSTHALMTSLNLRTSSLRHGHWCRVAVVLVELATASAQALDESLCDNSYQDCRTPILNLIRNENVGIDVSFWFMTDSRYSQEIIKRWQAGVPVRVMLDLDADANYPANASIRQSLIAAGIPIRHKTTAGINHWKMMLYAGQAKMQFSAANFANGSYSPVTPYTNYVDEAIYFTDDSSIVTSFMRKFDDLWTDTVNYQNVANVTTLGTELPDISHQLRAEFPAGQRLPGPRRVGRCARS